MYIHLKSKLFGAPKKTLFARVAWCQAERMAKAPKPPMGRGATNLSRLVLGNNIGERIQFAREEAGFNKSQLARELGCTWVTLHKWENNVNVPRAEAVEKICKVLGMTPEELLGVAQGQQPTFAAWPEFLQTPEGRSMTPEETDMLRALNWPANKAPTVTTYVIMLGAIRSSLDR